MEVSGSAAPYLQKNYETNQLVYGQTNISLHILTCGISSLRESGVLFAGGKT